MVGDRRRAPPPNRRTRTAPSAGRARRRPAVADPPGPGSAGAARGRKHLDVVALRGGDQPSAGCRPTRRPRTRASLDQRGQRLGSFILTTAAGRHAVAVHRRSGHRDDGARAAGTPGPARAHRRPARIAASRRPSMTTAVRGRRSVIGCSTPARLPVDPAGCRRSTTARSRPVRPTASPDDRSRWKWTLRVLVRARVAAADVPARQAHPQVRPGTLAVLRRTPGTARA